MHIPLDPVTQGKIEAFARRRRRLVFRRGVCASIFAAVVALTAVALLDWCVILSEPIRLALSIAAYVFVAAVIWRVWLRLLVHAPGLTELARFIESAHPPLREDLLSAVELGTERDALALDSPIFRRLLQESVAGRITALRPEALLPPRLIRRWVGLAAAALAVFAALFAVPELHFAQLLARAALPTANIERVSRTQVTVLEPTPPDKTVPQGDTVQIKVAVHGPAPDAVTLELLRKDAPAESLTMEPAVEALQYRAALQTDENPLRYRIRAGDAITRTYTITPRLRPYVASFDITYQDPAYMGGKFRTQPDLRRGDLAAYAGTTATLILRADQPIAEGVIEADQGGAYARIALTLLEPTKLLAKLPIGADGQYKVALIAAETRFDNGRFSPRYEIRALKDAVPIVRIEEPAKDLLVPPDELIELVGVAGDDVALARVARAVKINDREPVDTVIADAAQLPREPGARVPVRSLLDLAALNVAPGDRVTVTLVASDLKGSVGRSAPLRLTIASSGFTPADTAAVLGKRAAMQALERFEKTCAAAREEGRKALKDLDAGNAAALREKTAAAAAAAGRIREEAQGVRAVLLEALRVAADGADSHELAAIGAAVDRIGTQAAQDATEYLGYANRISDVGARNDPLRRTEELCDAAARESKETREIFGEILAADEAALLMCDVLELERDQLGIAAAAGRGDAGKERWLRRQRTALRQIEEVEFRFHDHVARQAGIEHGAAEPAPGNAWRGIDVGAPALAGSARIAGTTLTLQGAGEDMGKLKDQCYFAYQVLRGDGQIVARLSTFATTHELAKAGLMLRAGFEDNAAMAGVHLHPAEGAHFLYRAKRGENAVEQRAAAGGPPRWLRLVRAGDSFTAYVSSDGGSWELVGRERLELPLQLYAGLVACSCNKSVACTATFDNPAVLPAETVEEEIAAAAAREAARLAAGPIDAATAAEVPSTGAVDFKRLEARPAHEGRKLIERLRTLREEIKKGLALLEAAPRSALEPKRIPEQFVAPARTEWANYFADQAQRADGERRRLEDKAPRPEQLLEELPARLKESAQLDKSLAERTARGDPREQMAGDLRRAEELRSATSRKWRALDLFQARAGLEEARPDGDATFVSDLDLVYRALGALRAAAPDEANLATLADVPAAFRVLEAGHRVAELATLLDAMQGRERWSSGAVAMRTAQPENGDLAHRLFETAHDRLGQARLPDALRQRLIKARDTGEWQHVRGQFDRRRRTAEPLAKVDAPLAKVAAAVREVKNALQDEMAKARARIAKAAPSLSEMMAGLAERADAIKDAARETANRLPTEEPEKANAAVDTLVDRHAALGEGLQDLHDALRRDANRQDTASEPGRERARDADDAIAMTDRPAGQAQEALKEAATSAEREPRADALGAAATRENDLAENLRQLARHYENLEKGADVAESRAALRGAERELGLEQPLGEQFAAAAELSALAGLTPQEQLAALERELPRNDAMQDELGDIARDALEDARGRLQDSSNQENAIAGNLAQAVRQQGERGKSLAERLRGVGNRTAELDAGRGDAAAKAAEQGKVDAASALADARASLQEAARTARVDDGRQVDQIARDADRAAELLGKANEKLQQGAVTAEHAAAEAGKAAQAAKSAPAGDQSAQQRGREAEQRAQQAGKAMAEAASAALTAAELQNEARKIAQDARSSGAAAPEAAQRQAPIAENVGEAGDTIERASRHENRLGETARGEALADVAQDVERTATQEVPAAGETLRGKGPAQGKRAVERARDAIDANLAELDAVPGASAAPPSGETPSGDMADASPTGQETGAQAAQRASGQQAQAAAPSGQESAAGPSGQEADAPAQGNESGQAAQSPALGTNAATGEALARALDQLDQALFGSRPGGQAGAPEPNALAAAGSMMEAAGQAQARSMRQGRTSGRGQGRTQAPVGRGFTAVSLSGASRTAPPSTALAQLPDRSPATESQTWGKLPSKLARDLMEGRREKVPEEYRAMVETYFRVIAEKARKTSQ